MTSNPDSDGLIDEYDLALDGGTYTVFAYNDTHDSAGHNDTVTVTKYTVTSNPTALAWKIDQDVNITFNVNSPITNGTLTIFNVSGSPNGSWTGHAGNYIAIENGVGTLEEFNATDLGNITYEYEPEGGVAKPADGLLQVTTAVATPTPPTVYIGEATIVEVLVTHPATGEALNDIRVGLDWGVPLNQSKLAKIPDDEFTDAEGKVQFSITTEASGNVTIYIKNGSDPNNKHIIKSAARKTMTISTDPSVGETYPFTVEAKDGNGDLITDAKVNIKFDGTTYTTETGTQEINAPEITSSVSSLNYPITATAEGYTSDSTTIMVVNQFKIFITAPTKASKGSEFTIEAAADDGNNNGITVAISKDGTEVASQITVNGKATFKLEGDTIKAGTYTITATKIGYTPADSVSINIEGGVPGFELLTLIVALGVAFILLRRRRKL